MDIGKRLVELRIERKFSQGDIEKRTGLLRCYISRVENGHTLPNLETLERMAKALEVEVYQLFFEGAGNPEPVPGGARESLDTREAELVGLLFRRADGTGRRLVLDIARRMAK